MWTKATSFWSRPTWRDELHAYVKTTRNCIASTSSAKQCLHKAHEWWTRN